MISKLRITEYYAILFEMVEEEHQTSAIAIKNILSGPLAFLTTTVLSTLLNHIQKNNNTIFGLKLYGQQFLAIIAIVVMGISCLLFFNFAKSHTPIRQHIDELNNNLTDSKPNTI